MASTDTNKIRRGRGGLPDEKPGLRLKFFHQARTENDISFFSFFMAYHDNQKTGLKCYKA